MLFINIISSIIGLNQKYWRAALLISSIASIESDSRTNLLIPKSHATLRACKMPLLTLPGSFSYMEIQRAWFICSYGGVFKLQGFDELTYVGGTNKLIYVDRRIDFAGMLAYICGRCRLDCNGYNFKYQLPDRNSLVSVTNDSDLHEMMLEFDKLHRVNPRHYPIRLFLFPNPKDVNFGDLIRSIWGKSILFLFLYIFIIIIFIMMEVSCTRKEYSD